MTTLVQFRYFYTESIEDTSIYQDFAGHLIEILVVVQNVDVKSSFAVFLPLVFLLGIFSPLNRFKCHNAQYISKSAGFTEENDITFILFFPYLPLAKFNLKPRQHCRVIFRAVT